MARRKMRQAPALVDVPDLGHIPVTLGSAAALAERPNTLRIRRSIHPRGRSCEVTSAIALRSRIVSIFSPGRIMPITVSMSGQPFLRHTSSVTDTTTSSSSPQALRTQTLICLVFSGRARPRGASGFARRFISNPFPKTKALGQSNGIKEARCRRPCRTYAFSATSVSISARHLRKPSSIRPLGRLRPINTRRLTRFSPSFQGRWWSPSSSMWTA